jgi:hypothetical protein
MIADPPCMWVEAKLGSKQPWRQLAGTPLSHWADGSRNTVMRAGVATPAHRMDPQSCGLDCSWKHADGIRQDVVIWEW